MIVVGLMSGTSADGIDAALTEISGEGFHQRVRLLAFHSFPYDEETRRAILAASNAPTHTARISQLNFLIGELFAEAAVETCRRAGTPLAALGLIGSHGQTIYHQSEPERLGARRVASTLQIGEPAVIAARTGATTVADFRTADMAVGGQGAPLVPYVDYLLYRDAVKGRVALNIGGIANLTAMPAGAPPEQILAFDTGPGNMVIDALVSQFSRGTMRFDAEGRMAASGQASPALLKELLAAAYFRMTPPKSCGREQFGAEFTAELLREGLAPADLVATATAFTAASIADAVERFVAPRMRIDEVIVSGGGLRNAEIMRRLREQMPDAEISASDDFGLPSDAKEAVAFAVLAHESLHGRPSNLPAATGASRHAVLGKISRPPL